MLVELLVAMVLSGVVGTIVLDDVVAGFRSQQRIQDRAEALARVRLAAESVSRQLRQADLLDAATDTQVVVERTDPNGTVLRHRWSVVTTGGRTDVVQETQTQTGAVASAWSAAGSVLTDVDAGTPVFVYGKRAQAWTPPVGSTTNATTCEVAGSSPKRYDPACVGTVTLHLVRKVRGAGPVSVDVAVDLRNAG